MEKLMKFLNTKKYKSFDDMVQFIDFLIENRLVDRDIYDKIDCIELYKTLNKRILRNIDTK